MSNYNALKSEINNNIYENQTQQITGTVLNTVLNAMTASLGAGYQFAGVATVTTDPGTPDQRVFYVAGEGIYSHFNNLQVPEGNLGFLKWDSQWRLETIEGLGGGSNLTGYVSVATIADLPSEGQPTLGYLVGTNLYLYVGEGGDTADGKYQNCGSFRGPEGAGITGVEQTVESVENGGRNTIHITLSNGQSYDVYVRNGKSSAGLFPDAATLNAQRPNPSVGEYAFVGSGFPADIYVCATAGTWSDSGEDYDGDNVDLTDYATKAELSQLEAEVDELDEELHEINPHITGRMGIGNTNTDITTSTLPEYTDQYGIATLVLDSPGYLWVCLENESFRVTSGGIEIPIVYVKDDGGLHCYVSAEMVNAGTLQFKVESIHPIKSDTERLTITARSYTITYGDAIPELGYTANGEVEGTPAITCEAVQGSDSGTYAIHIARGTVTDSNAIFVDGILTIEKAELTVTADDKFVELNGTMPTFTMQYSGFVLGEDESDLDTVPTCITDAEDTATAGAYTITPGGGVSDNYTFVYVPGILRVGVTTLLSWTAAELFAGKSVGGYIDVATNKKKTSTNYWGIVINVDGLQGKTVKFTKHYSFFRFAFMKSCGAWTNGGTISFSDATGYTAQVESNADTLSVEIPADTKYIYVYTTYNQNTNTAPDIEITGTAETSKTILLAASLFTANKTIGSNGTVYTGNDAKTVFCTIDPLRVETYSFLHDVAVTLANMPAAYDLMAFAVAQYTASNKFIKRVGYTDIPDSIELDPAADTFHLMMFGSLNGDQVEISSVPIGDNDIQLTVIDN